MALRNTDNSYGTVTKTFHWLIAVTIYCMIGVGYYMGTIEDKALAGTFYQTHKAVGLTVLALVLLRFLWRLSNTNPTLPDTVARWQAIAARSVHYGLYGLLVAMPISGWIMSSAAGSTPSFFGLFDVPNLVSPDKALAKSANWLHHKLAIVLIVMIIIHVSAAIKHHVIDKDNVLKRMLPGGKD